MLKMNYEFRKGILLVRLLGNFDKDHYQRNIKKLNELIKEIGITNIVLNIDEIKSIDISGINYILNYYKYIVSKSGSFILCEKDNTITKKIFKEKIPWIDNELKAFALI